MHPKTVASDGKRAFNVREAHTEGHVVFGDGTSSPPSTIRCLLINVGDHVVLHVKALPQTEVIEKSGLVCAVRYVGHGHIGYEKVRGKRESQ